MARIWKKRERLTLEGVPSRIPFIKEGRCPSCGLKLTRHVVRLGKLTYCDTKDCHWLSCTNCLVTIDPLRSRKMPLGSAPAGIPPS